MDLATAKVLVTGGSAGIGLATARSLRARGASVAICGRDADRLGRAARELGCLGLRADVSRADDVTRLVAEAADGLGGLDVLVNNAGVGYFAPLVDQDLARCEEVLRTNLLGAMLVGQACARRFVAQRRGTIVNVGSTAARRGFPGARPTSRASSPSPA